MHVFVFKIRGIFNFFVVVVVGIILFFAGTDVNKGTKESKKEGILNFPAVVVVAIILLLAGTKESKKEGIEPMEVFDSLVWSFRV